MKIISILTSLFIGLVCAQSFAATKLASNEYTTIQMPLSYSQPANKIEVIGFFSYGCPACYSVNQNITAWKGKLPTNVSFRYVPVVFNDSWKPLAKTFYTAQGLNVEDKIHTPLFHAIHDLHKPYDVKSLTSFFENQGIQSQKFSQYYNSFTIDTQVNQGQNLMRSFAITHIPTYVVAGKYRTDLAMTKSPERLTQVLDALIAKARQ